jgi:hypothetical protein
MAIGDVAKPRYLKRNLALGCPPPTSYQGALGQTTGDTVPIEISRVRLFGSKEPTDLSNKPRRRSVPYTSGKSTHRRQT